MRREALGQEERARIPHYLESKALLPRGRVGQRSVQAAAEDFEQALRLLGLASASEKGGLEAPTGVRIEHRRRERWRDRHRPIELRDVDQLGSAILRTFKLFGHRAHAGDVSRDSLRGEHLACGPSALLVWSWIVHERCSDPSLLQRPQCEACVRLTAEAELGGRARTAVIDAAGHRRGNRLILEVGAQAHFINAIREPVNAHTPFVGLAVHLGGRHMAHREHARAEGACKEGEDMVSCPLISQLLVEATLAAVEERLGNGHPIPEESRALQVF